MAKTEKPELVPDEKPTTAASDAAVVESEAETTADHQVTVTFLGVEFSFDRRRVDDVRFRRFMQRGQDILALEWLLTPITVSNVLNAIAEKNDGIADDKTFNEVFAEIGKAAGAGN